MIARWGLTAGSARFCDRTADDAEYLELRECCARNEDALRIRVGVGRRDGDPKFAQLQKVVGDDPLEDFSVTKVQANPQAVGLRTGPESLTLLGVGLILKIAHERNGADLVIRNNLKLGGAIKEFDAVGPQVGLRTDIAVNQAFVKATNADLFCG